MSEALEILQTVFGYQSFRGGQEEVINNVISGKDVIYLTATGGGKSLCYQIPAIVRDGVGVIVSPLKALMKDQIDTLQALGVAADTINSDVTGYDRLNIIEAMKNGDIDLLYVTPELLAQPKFMETLKGIKIACFGIDEAHAASSLGHDFRTDYQVLGMLPHHFPGVPRIAVTATADPQTLADIKTMLSLKDAVVFEGDLDRANIHVSIEKPATGKAQKSKMLDIIKSYHGQSGLVYCIGKNTVDKVTDWLIEEGVSALPYHGGMSSFDREINQDRFLNGEIDVMVCTVAFGMGVDKSDIRYVIHNDMPASIESYQQEIGRAGRDGLPAEAFMFVSNRDINLRKRMIKTSKAGAASKRTDNNKLDTMIGLSETLYCRRRAILSYFGKTYSGDCGHCDNCEREMAGLDVSSEVATLLAYLQTNEGVEDTHSLQQYALMSFTGFGHDEQRWGNIIRQVIANGLVAVRHSNMGRLYVTEQGRSFKATTPFVVVKKVEMTSATFTKSARGRSMASSGKPRKARTFSNKSVDYTSASRPRRTKGANKGSPLLEALRSVRNRLANERNVPKYHIIHDSALRQMAVDQPLDADSLLSIRGVGKAKVASYGHLFIPVVRQYAA
jgi:ATP-dependent DNA helicase RecQ